MNRMLSGALALVLSCAHWSVAVAAPVDLVARSRGAAPTPEQYAAARDPRLLVPAAGIFDPTAERLVNPLATIRAPGAGRYAIVQFDTDARVDAAWLTAPTAVASMFLFLQKIHHNLDFYMPHRYREGYGVGKAGIDFAKENGFTLMISLDCGIKSADLIAYAKELGIDFIVCDHHLPDKVLPPAVAILDPKQTDCLYPFKELCGCGVGFKLMCALEEKLNLPKGTAFEQLDLVATAIAADIVPVNGENRILAFHGLKKANENPNKGIKALTKLSGLVKELHITNLVFMIAPRVNAAGRMDDASKAVRMFIAKTEDEAMNYAEMLHSDNTDRKEADSSITEEALALIQENKEWVNRKSTVVFKSHWHKGVVGIVASRLIEHYYRPTIVLTRSGDYAAGSARSVPGFNLYERYSCLQGSLVGLWRALCGSRNDIGAWPG